MRAFLLLLIFFASPLWAASAEDRRFEQAFGEAFLDSWWARSPDAGVAVGYYKYADRLPIPDKPTVAAFWHYLNAQQARLETIDSSKLSPALRADWALLKNQFEASRWYYTEFGLLEWDPSSYNVAETFAVILNTDYAPLETRLRTILKRLERVPAFYAAGKANIKNPVREFTQLAIEQNQGGLDVFGEDMERAFASSKLTPKERALFFTRVAAARAAITDFIAFLKDVDAKQGDHTRSFRIGSAHYAKKFAYDIQSSLSAEQLYQRALVEKEKLHAQMASIAEQLWPKYMGDTPAPADRLAKIGALIKKISEKHIAREQFVDEVKRQIPLIEAWVRDKDLLSQDPTRPLEVRETPAHQRGFSIASLQAPGPYDPTAKTYYNVSPLDAYTPDQAESFLREYNDYILQILNIHEAVPGHYLQLLYANKSPSRIKALFGNGAMIEGWAVYSERMMLESGYAESPEMWLMYAKWNLRVVCNTILDYRLHNLNMSEAEVMQLLTLEAFQSETEAKGKWRRARLSSVQLTSYFAGYAEIYDFREQLKREQGEAFNLKRFHEQFLSYGSAPVGVIKRLMTQKD